MDTDVMVYRIFDDLLDNQCILGFEEENYIATSFMACVPRQELIKEFIDRYENVSFYNEDKSLDLTTNVQRLTQILEDRGLIRNNKFQKLGDINIYPQEYFSPYDYRYYEDLRNDRTIAIHHYYKSWISNRDKLKQFIKKFIIKVFGTGFIKNIYEK